jgi:hypothetical protein
MRDRLYFAAAIVFAGLLGIAVAYLDQLLPKL